MKESITLLALFLVGVAASSTAQMQADVEDWSKSPEAYFLTAEERREWKALDSKDRRADFIERYWLKRDPSPGTEKNEFRDVVLGRIKTADSRFPIGKTPGSRTARGLLFVVLGSPSRVTDLQAPRPEAPRAPQPGGPPRNPVGVVEGTETTSTWVWDRERNPRLLEALGKPYLEIAVVLEPQRHADRIQSPGLFNEYWEILARKSIVNPDLVPPPAPVETQQGAPREALSHVLLSSQIRGILEKAPSSSRGDNGTVFGSAVLHGKSAEAAAIAWFFLPQEISDSARQLTFHALVRSKRDNADVLTSSQAASPAVEFSRAGKGVVVSRRFPLPPGEYQASFALTGADGRSIAAAATGLNVPEPEERFSVSSLLLSAGPGPIESGAGGTFVLGSAQVAPRADALFSQSESLWYFLEVGHPADPSKVTYELRLRRGAETAASNPWSPAELSEVATGRYVFGFEIPLKSLEPGDYTLYVTVRDGESAGVAQAVRRGDFRVRGSGS